MAARSAVSLASGRDDDEGGDNEGGNRGRCGGGDHAVPRPVRGAIRAVEWAKSAEPRRNALARARRAGNEHGGDHALPSPGRGGLRAAPLQPLRTAEAVEPETPSYQRRAFLASPQDSVSTMGSVSPTAVLAHGSYVAKTPSALQETLLSGAAESAFGGGGPRVRPRLTNDDAHRDGRRTDGKENDAPAVPQTIQRAAKNVRFHSQEDARQQQQQLPPL
ncbi:hypothetical protein THAOC_01800 [Thalassiosira oceanica]|uniref:Uncharacterized protein n=1 Tax=Thalassiosira oceanica TaxID=159749 RepID=K0TCH3_THAOC|nr:hypothetical protein THAOC_01800 [Thalassiosira oceanica]|eukprot:EJK76438.1 hypothetical protein THAOC_01800 [Thalassiosira oceanica]